MSTSERRRTPIRGTSAPSPVATVGEAGWQDAFVHTTETVRALCHDMRQPLTALRLLAESAPGPNGDARASMIEEVKWLTVLVESVLGESADSGLVEFWAGEVALDAAHLQQTQGGCPIRVSIREPVRLRGRRVAFQRALLCLLDNATRAASEGGHVDVVVEREGSHGTVTVADDGPGLGQLPKQHSLGLSTVRAVLADLGGHLSLTDGATGGAVATMHVPVAISDSAS